MSTVDPTDRCGRVGRHFRHMRSWLDYHDCVPMMFDPIANQTGTLSYVEFEEDGLVDAFRQEFGGAVRGPPRSQDRRRSDHINWPEKVCAKATASPSALNCRLIVMLAPSTAWER
jgi:hypothetical protein